MQEQIMSFNDIILWLAAIGAILGGADVLFGNRFGLGKKFSEAFSIMGTLALSVTGIIVLAPVLAQWLQPVLVPVFRAMHADPAMFASIIANDMGGYSLAAALAENESMGLMSGCITASMLGCTITFSLPVGMGLIEKRDVPFFVRGLLIGLIVIPIGSIAGGMIAGFNTRDVWINNLPIAAFSLLLALGFALFPDLLCRIAACIGKAIGWIGVVGIVTGTFSHLTGLSLPFLQSADSIMNALEIVAAIVVVLIGILPMLELLTRLMQKPLKGFGRLLGVNATSASGLIYSLANSIPVFGMFKDMDNRGKVINVAWLVPATAALGDHLGFTAGVQPDMIVPMISGKLIAGVCAVAIAYLITRKTKDGVPD